MNRDSEMMRGMLLGAGLMYFLDPDKGRRRRAVVRDRFFHLSREAGDGLDAAGRDLRNRTWGAAAETRARFRRGPVPDGVLEARVRSALGRLVSHPGAITVTARDGEVTLSGDVLVREHDRLRRGVAAVHGVREVVNDLSVHDEPGDVASLQGGVTRRRGGAMQQRWPPGTRLLAGVAGTGLALRGLRGDGALDSLAGLVGFGLVVRALTDLDARRLTGVSAGRRAVDVQKMITIDAPVDEVFAFWSDFENFPRFMSHLREVRDLGDDRSHWVATGPGGVALSWDAVVTERRDDELIRWRSIDGSPVENAGTVRFQDEGGGRTRVDVHLVYNPPAGALGHAVASLFGSNPRQMMNDDLLRLKSLLEDGKTTAHHQSVERGELAENAGAGPAR